MPLTDGDREKIRYHLGYVNVGATNNNSQSFPPPGTPGNAASLLFSVPRPVETLFWVEDAMNLVLEIAVPRIRRLLAVLDQIEAQLIDSLTRLKAAEVGNIKLRPAQNGVSEQDALEREYWRWSGRLADQLGVPRYPFSDRHRAVNQAGRVGTVRNVPVGES
jgi:hypothetical protein